MKKSTYPHFGPIHDHIEALEANLELLKAFAARYPDAKPSSCSALLPTVMFDSSATGWCRDNLGREGWTVNRSTASKVVDGVEVELAIQPKLPEPFTL